MELRPGQVAVVTGAASGIGLALAHRFASAGLHVVLADVEADALARATHEVQAAATGAGSAETLAVRTDVSKEAEVQALAQATLDRFGAVHVVCNNAGVGGTTDPWSGPLAAWEWVFGVNLWGVVHGVRAFLPHLVVGGEGHVVNTASIAGLMPGFGAIYDATKHAVVALTEQLFHTLQAGGLPVGVSVLCPGWVRTGIMDSTRNWPTELGAAPEDDPMMAVVEGHYRRAIDEGTTPAAIADLVAEGIEADRFWILPHQDFLDLAVRRWERIAHHLDPEPPEDVPGLPPRSQMMAEILAALLPPE
jgi:NAD(P)-dependent dehydrogenase (short-subunit alcohol dehydrogenase family)